ncbi:hypothetical protein AB0I35_25255 [Nocardia sp. NPDC050378]|uniref:hypothetical protein n=1 Tax=Nocardia sp. NPDC050378 TaxID=3155400 RepID=UPI0033D71A69
MPYAEISYSEPGTALTDRWLLAVQEEHIVSDSGTLLLAAPDTPRTADFRWFSAKLTERVDVSKLVNSVGSVEFAARSEDGRFYCGVTSEENGHWIVAGTYPLDQPPRWIELIEWPSKHTATFAAILQIFQSVDDVPRLKIALMKVLHEVYLLPIGKAKKLAEALDEGLHPLIPEDQLELLWRCSLHPT